MNYETSVEIEIAIAGYFGARTHIIVPNVSWGMFGYELDLCILNNKSFYASEVEIKISKFDLKRDCKKGHHHDLNGNLIKNLWFAMPEKLECCADLVPVKAGILLVSPKSWVREIRKPLPNPIAKKWTVQKAYELARLGTLRIWDLKRANIYIKSSKVAQ
jgi:hypothetical protein